MCLIYKINNWILRDSIAFNGLIILVVVAPMNITSSKWLKFRPAFQNAVACIDPIHWFTEKSTLRIIAQFKSRIHFSHRFYTLRIGSEDPSVVTAENASFND